MSDDPIYRAFEEKVRQALDELVADVRRKAAADAAAEADTIRRAAAAEAAGLLAEAERRRNDLLGEIQRLERQLASVSAGIQALLQGEVARIGAASAETSALVTPRPEAWPGSEHAAPPTAGTTVPPMAPVRRPPPRAPEPEPAEPETEPRPVPIAPPPAAPEPQPVAAPPPRAPEPPPAPVEASETERTEVSVAGTPSFARALELQRGIQRSPGVRHVQALQFERGTLVLAVEHESGIDLAEAVKGLPNVQLEQVGEREGRLDFAFSG